MCKRFLTKFCLTGHHCVFPKEAPEHTLKRCVQDEIRNIDCQDIKTGNLFIRPKEQY